MNEKRKLYKNGLHYIHIPFKESTITNTTTANNKTGSTTESQVPEVIPHEKEKGDAKDGELSGNNTQTTTETTTEVHYSIVPSDTNHTINANNSGTKMYFNIISYTNSNSIKITQSCIITYLKAYCMF